MSRRLLATLVLTLTLFARPATAQTPDRDGVRRAVLDYVEGFYEGDTTKLVRSVRPDVFKYGFDWVEKSRRYEGEQMPYSEVLGYAIRFKARGRPTSAAAPRTVELFEVQDQTASAKLTAWWGTDYLLLARYDGRWMISSVMWQSPPPKSSTPAPR